MRWTFLLALSVLSLSIGCSTSAGLSQAQIETAHASAGYIERDYAPMQAHLP